MAEKTVDSVEFLVGIKGDVAAAANVRAALAGIGQAAQTLNNMLSALSGAFGGFTAGLVVFETVRKSMEAASAMAQSTARLTGALRQSAGDPREVQRTIQQVSASSVYSQQALTEAAAQLLERGVPQEKLTAALEASANLASGLALPLTEAAEQIAGTMSGTLARGLSRAVPGLRDLTKTQLQLGDAIDLVNARFAGQADILTTTPFGKAQQQANLLETQYEDLGNQLVRIENDVLPTIIGLFGDLNSALGSPAGQTFLRVLTGIIQAVIRIGPLVAIFAGVQKAVGMTTPLLAVYSGAIGKITEA